MSLNLAPILIVEDSPTQGLTYKSYMKSLARTIHVVETGAAAISFLNTTTPAVVLLDLKLPDMDGLEILRHIKQNNITTKAIVITAHGSVTVAVDAMREGAVDFLLKPFNTNRLITTVTNALEMQRLSTLVESFTSSVKHQTFGKFIGDSAAMQAVYRMISDAAPSNASVFIGGDSGTGKELCADAVHQLSSRRESPFIALNCASIPANLIESEIFGHKKGAFTGATEDREGAASRADGGTLFLDEICEMPLDLQVKLLRFIQTRQITPVGDSVSRSVNVRFICATNRDPWKEMQEGRFREDLYYRLHVIPIQMPPLRSRDDDILQISNALMKQYAVEEGKTFSRLSSKAETMLKNYSWPGNVRELGNIIQSTVVLNDGDVIEADMLPHFITKPKKTSPQGTNDALDYAPSINTPDTSGAIVPLHIAERRIIEATIQHLNGSVGAAARALEVNPSTLYRKMKAWDQDR